jgi:NAD(P)-dependent dehydrogenase (short-subunit alcohol dehydrogenase family)
MPAFVRKAIQRAHRSVRAWRDRLNCRFSEAARREVRGKRILITGATGGIGEAAAAELVRSGAWVLVHGQSVDRIAATVARLTAQARHGGRIIGYQADLSDPAQIERLIAQVQQDHPHLDGLINNAGVGYVAERRVDSRGIEWVWAINVLAPWQLAQGLASSLAKGTDPRVVNVASGLLHPVGEDLMLKQEYEPILAYGRSKQALIVLSLVLAEEFKGRGISVTVLDPGTVDTPMAQGFSLTFRGVPVQQAGRLLGKMVADPSLSDANGQFYSVGRRIDLPAQATDEAFRNQLAGTVRSQARSAGKAPGDAAAAPA